MAIRKSNHNRTKAVIYKYVVNGEVVYVGKTNRALESRILEHCQELKFFGMTEVYYYETTMVKDIWRHEAYWLNHYKPILNKMIPSLNKALGYKPRNAWHRYKGKIKYIQPLMLQQN